MKREPFSSKYTKHLDLWGLTSLPPEALTLHRYEKREYICREGQTFSALYILLHGTAKNFTTISDGKLNIITFYNSGDMIGDLEFMGRRPEYAAFMQAETDILAVCIPLPSMNRYLSENTKFLSQAGYSLAQKLYLSAVYNSDNLLNPLEYRLCSYISLYHNDGIFQTNLTNLASMFGTSYRHLLRTLKDLCENGILEKQNRSYIIIDMERLLGLAEHCSGL